MRANPVSMDPLTDGKYIIDGFFSVCDPESRKLDKILKHV